MFAATSIDNVTPADVYFSRSEAILAERKRTKLPAIANRRLQHRLRAAYTPTPDGQTLSARAASSASNHLTTDNLQRRHRRPKRSAGTTFGARLGDASPIIRRNVIASVTRPGIT